MLNISRVSTHGRGGVALAARPGEYLDNDILARFAPTVFANQKHSSRSERFEAVPTVDLMNRLNQEGFVPVKVQVGGSRDAEKRAYTKHLVRFRRMDDLNRTPVRGDSLPEVVMLNANDGTSSYQIMAGLFRLVCANGMIVSDEKWGQVRVGHYGSNVLDRVIEGTYTVLESATKAIDHAEQMRAIKMDRDEERAFGEAAMKLRFDEGHLPSLSGDEITRARRTADTLEDRGSNLWLTFNKTQENLIRGGLYYSHKGSTGRYTHRLTRPVKSADGDVRLNRALWNLATETAARKGVLIAA